MVSQPYLPPQVFDVGGLGRPDREPYRQQAQSSTGMSTETERELRDQLEISLERYEALRVCAVEVLSPCRIDRGHCWMHSSRVPCPFEELRQALDAETA